MALLDAADLALLAAELRAARYSGLTDRERFDLFHAQGQEPNPAPAARVPRPMVAAELLAALAPASRAKVYRTPGLVAFQRAVQEQDRSAARNWIDLAASAGDILPEERLALLGRIDATIPDPAWPALVDGPSRKVALFGARTWTRPDGSTVDFVPLEDFSAARG